MKKVIIGIVVLVVVVLVAGIFWILSNLNSLVAEAIEKNGTEVTDTSVKVSGVDISIREGSGSIKGLTVANPDGFNAGNAFSLGDITIDIDLESLRDEPIVIELVRISAPVFSAEVTKMGKTNIDQLRKQIQAHTSGSGGGGGEGGEAGGPAKKIRIESFVFEKGEINVDASELGLEAKTVTLPEIKMTNIGGKDGALPDEIAKIILSRVTKQVASEIAGSEINSLIEKQLGGSIKDTATDKAKDLIKSIGK